MIQQNTIKSLTTKYFYAVDKLNRIFKRNIITITTQRFTDNVIYNKKVSSVFVINNYMLYNQKRFVGGNLIAKLLQKSVSGSFTLSNKLILHFEKHKGVLPYHLIHFLTRLPKKVIETPQEMFDVVSDLVISRDTLCDTPIIKPYGIIDNNRPFAFLYPFQQNFLAHATANKFTDIKNIRFSKLIPNIDLSEYINTGMTIHNLLEYNLLLRIDEDTYKYLHHDLGIKSENIKTILNNPINCIPHHFGNNIQQNPDATLCIYYIKNGAEQPPIKLSKHIPLDTKIIKDPVNRIEPLKGQISITSDFDLYTYVTRIKGSLTQIKPENNYKVNTYIAEFDKIIKNIKKDITIQISPEKLVYKYLTRIYKLNYQMWVDPEITGIYPSIVLPHIDKTTVMSCFEQKPFYDYLEKGNHKSIHAQLFPLTQDEFYNKFLLKFIEEIPKNIKKDSLQDNFNIFITSINHLTQKAIPWEF